MIENKKWLITGIISVVSIIALWLVITSQKVATKKAVKPVAVCGRTP